MASMGDLEVQVMRDLWDRVSVLDPEARLRVARWLVRATQDHSHEPAAREDDLPF